MLPHGRLRIATWVGRSVQYLPILQLQEALVAEVHAGRAADTLLLLEHTPTYTLGKRGRAESDFRMSEDAMRARGAEVVAVPRGGQTTWHGPGQLVAYPIVNLRLRGMGARRYVEALEDSVIQVAGAWGLAARGRVPGCTGVWLGDRKLAAVGVRIVHGVASHGLALNVCPDLSWFDAIVPCGQEGKAVTSMAAELGRGAREAVNVAAVEVQLRAALLNRLRYQQCEWLSQEELQHILPVPQPQRAL